MSCQENQQMGASENIVTTTTSNLVSTFITDKRTIPLLYMQSPVSQPSSTNVCSSPEIQSVTCTSTSLTNNQNPVNGVNGKLVQVQGPNQAPTFAFIGTVLKPSIMRKEPGHQKVLLAPVQETGGPVKRFILPRASPNVMKVMLPQSPGKQLCRNYLLQASPNSTLKAAPVLGTTTKTVTPNIIRQKTKADGKTTYFTPPNVQKLTSPNSGHNKIIIKSDGDNLDSILIHIPEISTSGNTPCVITSTSTPSTGGSVTMSVGSNSLKPQTSENPANPICHEVVTIEDDGDEDMTQLITPPNLPPLLPINKLDFLPSPKTNCFPVEEVKKEKPQEPKQGLKPVFVERARKRKGQLLNEVGKKTSTFPWQVEASKPLPGAEDYDPIQVIEWDSTGLGKLPGSDIKFTLNEFGLLEVFEDRLKNKTCKGEDSIHWSKERDPDEIFCCINCKCYGLISEFYSENFCSKVCKDNLSGQQALIKKRLSENESEVENKKKRKLLELAMNSRPFTLKKEKEIKSPDSEESEEEVIKEEEEVISIDDDDNENDPLSPSSVQDELLGKISSEDVKPQLVKCKATIPKKEVKEDRHDKPYLPHRTYSKFYKRSSLNLRTREVDPCDEEVFKEYLNAAPEEVSDTDPKLSDTPKKHDNKKQNNTGNIYPKNAVTIKEKKSEEFRWSSYLSQTLSKPAWFKLFQSPYPTSVNTFKVGYKLEAIDPEHQSYFCAATVVEVKGFRLKLHFDGYSKAFDFWVNADSPNIFPCGYCGRKGIHLQPPWGYKAEAFSWQSYLSSWKARSAPLNCFQSCYQMNTSPNLFRSGMKLEAVDRKNSYLVCVATVAAVLGSRVLVHFDSWDDVYDYWAETSSPYIHYVGWCKETKHELTPPNGMRPSDFSWNSYLKETGAIAAPKRAFNLRPHIDFKKGTKLEAIDKRAPHLLRVATIKDDLPYQIKITFDGFPDHFGYWVDDDSPDIHPVGWGNKTGHPVESPPTEESPTTCSTPGCVGQGHAKGLKFESHSEEEDCPYSIDNVQKEDLLPDRLTEKPDYFKSTQKLVVKGNVIDLEEDEDSSESDLEEDDLKVRRWKWIGLKEKTMTFQKYKTRRAKGKEKEKIPGEFSQNEMEISSEEKVIGIRLPAKVAQDELAAKIEGCNSQPWTPVQVEEFAQHLLKKQFHSFIEEEIDGEAFLMLTQEDLIEQLGFKLGDAIKLFNAILLLRDKVT